MSMNQINYNIEIFLLGVLLCLFGASMASYRLGKYAADRWYAEHPQVEYRTVRWDGQLQEKYDQGVFDALDLCKKTIKELKP